MEAALAAEDPRLVSALSAKVRSSALTLVVRGLLFVTSGMVLLLTGLVSKLPAVSIVGFLVALFGVFSVISRGKIAGRKKKSPKTPKKPRGNFGDSFQQRWDNRQG